MSNKHNKDYTKYAKTSDEVVETKTEEVVESTPEVEPVVEPVVEETVTPEPEVVQPKTGRVFGCARLNVREAPKPKANIVCEIPCHTEVEIDEDESTADFYKIHTTSGIEGFCMKTYILEK